MRLCIIWLVDLGLIHVESRDRFLVRIVSNIGSLIMLIKPRRNQHNQLINDLKPTIFCNYLGDSFLRRKLKIFFSKKNSPSPAVEMGVCFF